MISGRYSLLATIRYASELSKKRCTRRHSAGFCVFQGALLSINGRQSCRPGRNIPSVLSYSAKMASSSAGDSEEKNKQTREGQNRLALEKSPYLLQHATNPVDWYPWCDEALERAKREDKVIFLSVGYSTCHWCHVMERESFKDKEVAKIMNEYFINIKVDREERPDIDSIYMAFIQAKHGSGGWPMSVFLAPDLTPICGRTYIQPEDGLLGLGFKTSLLHVARMWKENKTEALQYAASTFDVLKRYTKVPTVAADCDIPSIDCGHVCARQFAQEYEPKFGGFGCKNDARATKFPQPVNFNFLFHMYARDPTSELGQCCLEMCVYTLTKMAYGGIHDHVGQGFARYSIDNEWHVPHFEKMLYDQAQLMQSYADAFVVSSDPFFAEIVHDIVTYVTRDLRHEEGGFYSAEDADSYPELNACTKKEGAFYVWTYNELKSLLDKYIPDGRKIQLFDLFSYHYNVKKKGNVKTFQDPHGELTGKNVLIAYDDLKITSDRFSFTVEETKKYLKEACSILFEARSVRPRPHLDDKIVTAWNGLMISGLSRAGAILGNKKYIEYATDTAKFIEQYLFDKDEGFLLRSCYRSDDGSITQTSVPIYGFHDDYAFVVKGLLDLYEASFDTHWIEWAEQLQETQNKLFWDDSGSGYFTTTKKDPSVILRLKDAHDGAEPSGNSIACVNLLRLGAYLDRDDLKDRAARLLRSFRSFLMRSPIAFPQMVSALLNYHDGMTQIYIVGKRDAKDTDDLLRVIHKRLLPGRVLLLADQDDPDNVLCQKHEVVSKMKPQDGRATAYVCRHHTCSLPVTDPGQLAALLDERQ
ncbi:hypothetical protein KM043_011290 [Ampulex compressa]|nr:hypothetical protein KM043_011290 [Ampulex compressa]